MFGKDNAGEKRFQPFFECPKRLCSPVGRGRVSEKPNEVIVAVIDSGVEVDHEDLKDMIWSVPEQIAILSRYFELAAGDLIFSGTPEGVGAVKRGETMSVAIAGVGKMDVKVF